MLVNIGMQIYCLLLGRIEALSLAGSNTMTKHLVPGGKQPFLSRSSSGSPSFSQLIDESLTFLTTLNSRFQSFSSC
jgi:hypothetical protein